MSTYANLALNQTCTGKSPAFCRPLFIHGHSDADTYQLFFSWLAAHLQQHTFTELRLGSATSMRCENHSRCPFPERFSSRVVTTFTRTHHGMNRTSSGCHGPHSSRPSLAAMALCQASTCRHSNVPFSIFVMDHSCKYLRACTTTSTAG